MKRILCLITNFVEQIKIYFGYEVTAKIILPDKKITIDMLDIVNPKVTIGKDVTPNDIATFIVRTAVNMDAAQYIHGLEATGHTDVAYRLGTLTTAKMEVILNESVDEMISAASNVEVDANEPLISPIHSIGIYKP